VGGEKNRAPPQNKMKPISPFGLGFVFFLRFVSNKLMISIGALHTKIRFEQFWLKLQPKLATPAPNQKFWLRP